MKNIFLIFLLISAFFMIKIETSYDQKLTQYYLEDDGTFDDVNPLWGPDGLTLAFERIYKSGDGNNEFFVFTPFSEIPNKRSVSEENKLLKTKKSKNYYNGFCWVDIKGNIYKYIYSVNSDLYISQVDFSSNRSMINILFSTENGQNKYADYSDKNKMVAFVSGITGNGDIYVKRLDNNNVVQVTHTDFLESSPKWSPDGESLAFSSLMNRNMDIFAITNIKDVILQGAEAKIIQLTKSSLEEMNPTWSPDGKLIAFYSLRKQIKEGGSDFPKLLERDIFDLGVVDLEGNSFILAEDIYRQEKRGPVWVNIPQTDDQYIFFVRSEYKSIESINVSQYLKHKQLNDDLIKGLTGYNFGNITDIDCNIYYDSAAGHRLQLAYSAMIDNFQKRIYIAQIEPFFEKETNKVVWKIIRQY